MVDTRVGLRLARERQFRVEVRSDCTMTSDSLHFAPFHFTVELKPGEYVVAIIEEQSGTPMSDTRTFTPAGLSGSGV